MRIETEVKFIRKEFEAIFYKDNSGNLFLSPTVVAPFRNFALSALTTVSVGVYVTSKGSYVFLIGAFAITVYLFFVYYQALEELRKWKNAVDEWLDREERYGKHILILTEGALTLVQDGIETIEKWTKFDYAKISDQYIELRGASSFLLPAKSVSKETYNEIRAFIVKKVQEERHEDDQKA